MIELLAPAGDLEKLKIALTYGADACFIGGQSFSLRARASNFDLNEIKEACEYAHKLGKKVYVTTNIIPHEEDYEGLIPYLKGLEDAKVDAIITASPYIIETALKETSLEVHLSTQQSAMNAKTVNYWYNRGVKRIVLGRELSKYEIDELIKNTKADIEVFIHGGMCMSYSGRCSLSNNLTNRDANRGGCAHSCRWEYDLKVDNKSKFDNTFSMSSKDLVAIQQIPNLIDANVASLKIEGRMKSLHYIATVVNTYRKLIDEYLVNKEIKDFSIYEAEMEKAENRLTSFGYLEGMPTLNEQLFNHTSTRVNQIFTGMVVDYDKKTKIATIEQRNRFGVLDTLEVFSPNFELRAFKVLEIKDLDGNILDQARHPKQLLKIEIPFEVSENDILRLVWKKK